MPYCPDDFVELLTNGSPIRAFYLNEKVAASLEFITILDAARLLSSSFLSRASKLTARPKIRRYPRKRVKCDLDAFFACFSFRYQASAVGHVVRRSCPILLDTDVWQLRADKRR